MTEWKKGTLKTLFTLSLRIQSFLHMGKKAANDKGNNKCPVPPSSNGTKDAPWLKIVGIFTISFKETLAVKSGYRI